nr:heterogeneous nuclear ribonucleoprotein F isoform X3 [Globicephala melas]
MRPLGPAHGRPPQSPRPAVVFASFRLRLGSGTTPRLSEEKGAQRDDEVPDVKKSGGVETWSPRTVRYLPGVSSTVGIPRCSLSLDSWVSDGTCTSLSGRAPVTPLVH